jgi:hypothetical protein
VGSEMCIRGQAVPSFCIEPLRRVADLIADRARRVYEF